MIIKKSQLRLAAALLFALITVMIPWAELRSMDFADRQVYLEYVSYGTNRLEYLEFTGIASYISNESLWHLILKFCTTQNYISAEEFFQLLSVFTLSIFSVFMVRRFHPAWLLLLLNPLVLDF